MGRGGGGEAHEIFRLRFIDAEGKFNFYFCSQATKQQHEVFELLAVTLAKEALFLYQRTLGMK